MSIPLGAIVDVASKSMDFARVREERHNTEEMKANAEASARQELRDKITAAIAAGDLEEIRRLAAEI
jgi:hypothetical protein